MMRMGDKQNMEHGADRPGPNAEERRLLILDDDEPLRLRLAKAMEKRGFAVSLAGSVGEAMKIASRQVHDYALLDLRLEDGSGLEVVTALHDSNPGIKIVMLTGFGNIATAVSAVKAGAIDYLPKPVDADVIEKTLLADPNSLPHQSISLCRRTGCVGNISRESLSNAIAMSRKRRGVSICTGVPYSEFSTNTHRNNFFCKAFDHGIVKRVTLFRYDLGTDAFTKTGSGHRRGGISGIASVRAPFGRRP